jgi:hypothetical protein
MQISATDKSYVVIVHIAVLRTDNARAIELASKNFEIFERQPGFLGGALHIAKDGAALFQYLQWRSEADHHNCMQSADFQSKPAQDFMALVQEGAIAIDPIPVDALRVSD